MAKFNVFKEYSRDEFIDCMETLIDCNKNPDFISRINSQIDWARDLPENALICFEFQRDIIYPVAIYPY